MPCFQLVNGWAYPTLHPSDTTRPTFRVIGSFVYADRGGPWFRIHARAQ